MPEIVMRLILILCAGLYYAAFALSFSKKKGLRLPALILHGAAVIVNVGVIVYNYVVNLIENGVGERPFSRSQPPVQLETTMARIDWNTLPSQPNVCAETPESCERSSARPHQKPASCDAAARQTA